MIRFTPFLVCALLANASFATQTSFTDLERQAGDACPADPRSCEAKPSEVDSCCFETPRGVLLQTQFWNFKPAEGPVKSWTVHGLWADKCDSSFGHGHKPTGCGEEDDREFDDFDIRDLLIRNGKRELLHWMEEFWPGLPNNTYLWEHEWKNHGRCMSTLARRCKPERSYPGPEVAIFFQRTADEFKKLTTYDFLEDAGIVPHETKTYRLDDLKSAFENTDYDPVFECNNHHGDHYLSQIHYYFNLKGTIEHGTMVPIGAPNGGNCPEAGIRYPPKMH